MPDPEEIKIVIAQILEARMRVQGYQHQISSLNSSLKEEQNLIAKKQEWLQETLTDGSYLTKINGTLYLVFIYQSHVVAIDPVKPLGINE